MCIITFHYNNHPTYKLIVAANRDEFYGRPTKPVHYWEDQPNLLAGRDLEAMGTWLGITTNGRFAALTNYRERPSEMYTQSRGEIVTNFLTGKDTPKIYLDNLRTDKHVYQGFNTIVGTVHSLYYYGNRQEKIIKVPAGTHSISNELLNTPWPKVTRAKEMLHEYVLANKVIDENVLFEQLNDHTFADREILPDTGVGYELERQLSPIFIRTDKYGTRSSTVLLITHDGDVTFTERTFNSGEYKDEQSFSFKIKPR